MGFTLLASTVLWFGMQLLHGIYLVGKYCIMIWNAGPSWDLPCWQVLYYDLECSSFMGFTLLASTVLWFGNAAPSLDLPCWQVLYYDLECSSFMDLPCWQVLYYDLECSSFMGFTLLASTVLWFGMQLLHGIYLVGKYCIMIWNAAPSWDLPCWQVLYYDLECSSFMGFTLLASTVLWFGMQLLHWIYLVGKYCIMIWNAAPSWDLPCWQVLYYDLECSSFMGFTLLASTVLWFGMQLLHWFTLLASTVLWFGMQLLHGIYLVGKYCIMIWNAAPSWDLPCWQVLYYDLGCSSFIGFTLLASTVLWFGMQLLHGIYLVGKYCIMIWNAAPSWDLPCWQVLYYDLECSSFMGFTLLASTVLWFGMQLLHGIYLVGKYCIMIWNAAPSWDLPCWQVLYYDLAMQLLHWIYLVGKYCIMIWNAAPSLDLPCWQVLYYDLECSSFMGFTLLASTVLWFGMQLLHGIYLVGKYCIMIWNAAPSWDLPCWQVLYMIWNAAPSWDLPCWQVLYYDLECSSFMGFTLLASTVLWFGMQLLHGFTLLASTVLWFGMQLLHWIYLVGKYCIMIWNAARSLDLPCWQVLYYDLECSSFIGFTLLASTVLWFGMQLLHGIYLVGKYCIMIWNAAPSLDLPCWQVLYYDLECSSFMDLPCWQVLYYDLECSSFMGFTLLASTVLWFGMQLLHGIYLVGKYCIMIWNAAPSWDLPCWQVLYYDLECSSFMGFTLLASTVLWFGMQLLHWIYLVGKYCIMIWNAAPSWDLPCWQVLYYDLECSSFMGFTLLASTVLWFGMQLLHWIYLVGKYCIMIWNAAPSWDLPCWQVLYYDLECSSFMGFTVLASTVLWFGMQLLHWIYLVGKYCIMIWNAAPSWDLPCWQVLYYDLECSSFMGFTLLASTVLWFGMQLLHGIYLVGKYCIMIWNAAPSWDLPCWQVLYYDLECSSFMGFTLLASTVLWFGNAAPSLDLPCWQVLYYDLECSSFIGFTLLASTVLWFGMQLIHGIYLVGKYCIMIWNAAPSWDLPCWQVLYYDLECSSFMGFTLLASTVLWFGMQLLHGIYLVGKYCIMIWNAAPSWDLPCWQVLYYDLECSSFMGFTVLASTVLWFGMQLLHWIYLVGKYCIMIWNAAPSWDLPCWQVLYYDLECSSFMGFTLLASTVLWFGMQLLHGIYLVGKYCIMIWNAGPSWDLPCWQVLYYDLECSSFMGFTLLASTVLWFGNAAPSLDLPCWQVLYYDLECSSFMGFTLLASTVLWFGMQLLHGIYLVGKYCIMIWNAAPSLDLPCWQVLYYDLECSSFIGFTLLASTVLWFGMQLLHWIYLVGKYCIMIWNAAPSWDLPCWQVLYYDLECSSFIGFTLLASTVLWFGMQLLHGIYLVGKYCIMIWNAARSLDLPCWQVLYYDLECCSFIGFTLLASTVLWFGMQLLHGIYLVGKYCIMIWNAAPSWDLPCWQVLYYDLECSSFIGFTLLASTVLWFGMLLLHWIYLVGKYCIMIWNAAPSLDLPCWQVLYYDLECSSFMGFTLLASTVLWFGMQLLHWIYLVGKYCIMIWNAAPSLDLPCWQLLYYDLECSSFIGFTLLASTVLFNLI